MRFHCADCDRAPASAASGRPKVDARSDRTHRGGCRSRKPKVVLDATNTGMWRVRWQDGRLSDMTNLTRAKHAIAYFMDTEERRQRGWHRSLEGCPFAKTGKMPAGGALVPASGEHGVVASENGGGREQ